MSGRAGRGSYQAQREIRYVLLADDHPIVLFGLRDLLDAQPDLAVIGTVRTAGELYQTLEAIRPTLLIMDLSLGKGDGLDVLKSVLAVHDQLMVLIFSMHDEEDYAVRAVNAGARGYLRKDSTIEQLLEAVQVVFSGQIYLSEEILAAQRPDDKKRGESGVENLTDRELSVFRMIGSGLPTRSIAENLHLSIKTIEKHRENIKSKLGVNAGSKLAAVAAVYVWRSDGARTERTRHVEPNSEE